MSGPINITGETYGRLAVLSLAAPRGGRRHWLCRCVCGREKVVSQAAMRRGYTQSCGCLEAENRRTRNITHGMRHTSVYGSWRNMRSRCENPSLPRFEDYGGRGITVCKRWASFEAFYEDMGDPPTPKHSIERHDNDRGYEPDNCYWATIDVQTRNKRNNVNITFLGVTMCATDWAAWSGIKYASLLKRHQLRWPVEEMLLVPVSYSNRRAKQA